MPANVPIFDTSF